MDTLIEPLYIKFILHTPHTHTHTHTHIYIYIYTVTIMGSSKGREIIREIKERKWKW